MRHSSLPRRWKLGSLFLFEAKFFVPQTDLEFKVSPRMTLNSWPSGLYFSWDSFITTKSLAIHTVIAVTANGSLPKEWDNPPLQILVENQQETLWIKQIESSTVHQKAHAQKSRKPAKASDGESGCFHGLMQGAVNPQLRLQRQRLQMLQAVLRLLCRWGHSSRQSSPSFLRRPISITLGDGSSSQSCIF